MDPKLFGRYEIIRKLAGGGMGRVYLAYDPVLNRQVGLKLIDAGGDRDSNDVVAAERRGAILQDQLAKREQSGRVAQIFDVGDRDGYFYIAMEYIEGEDLSELFANGPLEPQRAVEIALDILDVLVKAHTFQTVIEERAHRGIIHGDIKPRNIRITSAGQVKVLDFGIAKAVSMTRSLTFNQFGSIPYSSPERLQTGDMDARSDVWSVAVVLFEMLTGKPYFEAEVTQKLEWMIRNYRALQPSIATLPAGLREILSRALDPDLSHRFVSAAAFRAALYEWRKYAVAPVVPADLAAADPTATRRTVYPNPDENTRRAPAGSSPGKAASSPGKAESSPGKAPPVIKPAAIPRQPVHAPLPRPVFRGIMTAVIALFLIAVFVIVYEVRMLNNADALATRIDSGRLSLTDAMSDYQSLARHSLFSLPLYPARRSLRNRYTAEADRVIADYREASDSTPVTTKDWKRAREALASAMSISPDDNTRGKYSLVNGYLTPRANLKQARNDFEEAAKLLPDSPDPHLGLATIQLSQGNLDEAEEELRKAERNGFKAGRRETRGLADGYRLRGERWLAAGSRAQGVAQMQDALKHAETDLAHAQDLYNSVAPFLNGVQLAEKVSLERDKAMKSLAEAEQAIPVNTPASDVGPK
jgi:tetratricopeptide (TPR) repeat protein